MSIFEMIMVFAVWNLGGFVVLMMVSESISLLEYATDLSFFNPVYIHEECEVNWFGATLIALIFTALCPGLALIHWLIVLCTFGRKH